MCIRDRNSNVKYNLSEYDFNKINLKKYNIDLNTSKRKVKFLKESSTKASVLERNKSKLNFSPTENITKNTTGVKNDMYSLNTVSYTHLDVYKRQV